MAAEERQYPPSTDDYHIEGLIGRGAFAKVFKAYCQSARENVAIKVIELEANDMASAQEDPFQKIRNESQLMLSMNHTNVVSSLACFVSEAEVWIVMPLLTASCADILKMSYPEGFPSERWIARILADVCKGLEYLHKQSMVHRDLKSGNILLDHLGSAKIADFGVSGSLIHNLKVQNRKTVTGTPCWMAPEVAENNDGHDSKADIWSLGITCIELMNGKPPYSNFSAVQAMMHILQQPPPSVEKNVAKSKNCTKHFKQFVSCALQKDPRKRKTATELLKMSFLNPNNLMPREEIVQTLRLDAEDNIYVTVTESPAELPASINSENNVTEEPANAPTWVFTEGKGTIEQLLRDMQRTTVATPQSFIQIADNGVFTRYYVQDVNGKVITALGNGAEGLTIDTTNLQIQQLQTITEFFSACRNNFQAWNINPRTSIDEEEFIQFLLVDTMYIPQCPEQWASLQSNSEQFEIIETVVNAYLSWSMERAKEASRTVRLSSSHIEVPMNITGPAQDTRFQVIDEEEA